MTMTNRPPMRTDRGYPRLAADERGMSMVFVGMGFLGFLAASTLAIDVGMFMVARSQAQNSADAGALAGVVSLVFDDPNDRSSGGPAVQNALASATGNQVMGGAVSVVAADVTFPTNEQVTVDVFRTGARGNPVATLMGNYVGVPTADVDATATAEAALANAATCVKPWGIPDKWDEQQTPAWDPTDTLDMYYENGPNKGNPLPNPDLYVPVGYAGYTGYQPSPQGPDYGLQLTLKPGNPQNAINPSHFYALALPPNSGAAWYEQNIPGCWPNVAVIGELVPVEPGNMVGPTSQGTQALIDQDPGAFWDGQKVVSSMSPSPRIVVIPVFDPAVYEAGRQAGRLDIQIANLAGFFIENMQGNDVVGRLVPMTGLIRANGGGNAPTGSFLRAIQLVQ